VDTSNVLSLFRAVMPGVRGVVLADPAGAPLAHDLTLDPAPLARAAHTEHAATGGVGCSTMVRHADGLYLVVFLSEAQANAFLPVPPAPAA
jgi:hypothetical protein